MSSTLLTDNRIPPDHLMGKYYTHEYTYNEYPHKSFWSSSFDHEDLKEAYRALAKSDEDVSQMLFVNVPFCEHQCLFCICYTIITRDYPSIQRYIHSLCDEMKLYRHFCEEISFTPDVREIHIGGGTPTILQRPEFDQVIDSIYSLTSRAKLLRFSLEIDPRTVTPEDLEYYAGKGIDRISFGIQDFDPKVQRAIARIQPVELLENLLTPAIRSLFVGFNFDVLCGLPRQTLESFRKTLELTLQFTPNRIMLMFLNYCPDAQPHQRHMNEEEFPSLEMKWEMFGEAIERLLDAGYVRIGFDHFALPGDDLVEALRTKTMHWNSLGYRPAPCLDMIPFGAGSLGRITEDYYVQNIAPIDDYRKTVAQGRFPVAKGHHLNHDEKVRQHVIKTLRCYMSVEMQEVEEKYGIEFKPYFTKELQRLNPHVEDGLVHITDDAIQITPLGLTFTAQICGAFDAHIPENNYEAHHKI
ncbi:MAG: oxygen-independent coproporphyrinogen III oxidase [Planctomycetes bacterium]|nr:oxygen-independent coproporphyrinogen III oxidase [Planctomycetota bacterium]